MNLIDDLRAIVGADGVLDADEVAGRQAGVWRSDRLAARALVRPRGTGEVAAVLRYCHAHRQPVVTHGGLTGLVHGADATADQLILSLERMRAIERVDPVQRVAQVQAGAVLQAVQEAAEARGLLFPLDLGGRGSATIGGNASTNAGGNRVIRYGMTRDMVLGLEAVLADGTVVSSLNALIKNNAGYDLKHLFIGTEGTLGIITRLVLRLREKPTTTNMAYAASSGALLTAASEGMLPRDRSAEQSLLERLTVLDEIPAARVRRGTAYAGFWELAARSVLSGMEAVRFTDSVLPTLEGDPDIHVETVGELTSYERAAEAPIVDVGLSDSSDGRTDWFDLAVTVSVGGEQVPFEGLFRALAAGDEALLLDSGTWFLLDDPASFLSPPKTMSFSWKSEVKFIVPKVSTPVVPT